MERNTWQQKRPLSIGVLSKFIEDLSIEWTYNSNNIEGNTLSLNETRIVLLDGVTVGGRTLRAHFEITNHYEAIGFVEGLIKPDYVLRTRDILDDNCLSISEIVLEPDILYGQEYVSLLARRGVVDAFKEGRNWVTTKNAIKDNMNRKMRFFV